MKRIITVIIFSVFILLLVGCMLQPEERENAAGKQGGTTETAYGSADEQTLSVTESSENESGEITCKFQEKYSPGDILPQDEKVKLTEYEDLKNFIEKYRNDSYEFCDFLKETYDETFFEENILFLASQTESSGSIRHSFIGAVKNGETVTLTVCRNIPGIGTCDMAYYVFLFELPKAKCEGVAIRLKLVEENENESEESELIGIAKELIGKEYPDSGINVIAYENNWKATVTGENVDFKLYLGDYSTFESFSVKITDIAKREGKVTAVNQGEYSKFLPYLGENTFADAEKKLKDKIEKYGEEAAFSLSAEGNRLQLNAEMIVPIVTVRSILGESGCNIDHKHVFESVTVLDFDV